MRLFKHILSALMLLTILSASAGIASQKVNKQFATHGDIMSKNMIVNTKKMKTFQSSPNIVTYPPEHEAMSMELSSNSQLNVSSNIERKEGEKFYKVKCVFNGQGNPFFAIYNEGCFLESKYELWGEESNTYYFEVPGGIYDVYASFYCIVDGTLGRGNLIHENVIIDADSEIVFSADELTEKITFKPYLRDGKEAILPLLIQLEEEPWERYDYTDSSITYSHLNYILFREGCEIPIMGYNIADYRTEDDETIFLSNKLSDNYHLIFQYLLVDNNGEIQITTSEVTGIVSREVTNYNQNFVKFDFPMFCKTPLFSNFDIEKYNIGLESSMSMNNIDRINAGVYIQKDLPDIYCAIQPIDEKLNIKSPIKAISVQGTKTITWEVDLGELGTQQFSKIDYAEIISLPANLNGSKWEYVYQNHTIGNNCHQISEEGSTVEYPEMTSYNYFADQIIQPIGNSSPISVLMTKVEEIDNAIVYKYMPVYYIGRYGEVRQCDLWTLVTVVDINGQTVFSNSSDKSYEDWCIKNSTDDHEKGVLEATFTNKNVLVDETIQGFNITTIKVDERNEDLCTPTTQMLIFKNSDGVITDRFSTGEEGLIEFSAGDFNWVSDGGYYTCEEADVKVEYAPYGEESFMPLEVEEIPENYYMPGFGYFYRGSLADVTMPSSNGWYDVRFTLTDKAGNEMVQHISPAFKIEKNTSVAEVTVDGIKVWSVAGMVLVNSSDIESMALYSADGKLIASTNGNSLPTNGYRGMGIVKVTSTTGISTTHKTVIR